MHKKTALELLGLKDGATPEEIKKAYRAKALQHHPDRNQGSKEAEEVFKKISEAYEVLTKGTTTTKDMYNNDYSDIDELFKTFMRSMSEEPGSTFFHEPRRSKLVCPVHIPIVFGKFNLGEVVFNLEDVLTKKTGKVARVRINVACRDCLGTESNWAYCSTCSGFGEVATRVKLGFGILGTQSSKCIQCSGRGWVKTTMCRACNNEVIYKKTKDLELNIPDSYSLGDPVVIRGAGSESWKGPNGDVMFKPKIRLPDISTLPIGEREDLFRILRKLK